MSRLTKARDTIVAYISLLFGAGLSVGANLADTLRIRGPLVDVIDVALAVGPPLAALLVVELFVSEWPRSWSVQSVRWVATLIVGTLATIVSWIHIHELLAARGQNPYVAMLWPVAIDGLAIMAMAKLLVTRGHVATGQMATPAMATQMATGHSGNGQGHASGQTAVATEPGDPGQWLDAATWPDHVAMTADDGRWPAVAMATQPDDPTIDVKAELARWQAGYDEAITDLGQEAADEAEAFLAGTVATARAVPVTPGEVKVPADVRALIVAMLAGQATEKEIDEAVMEMAGKSYRTARRYRAQVNKEVAQDGQE